MDYDNSMEINNTTFTCVEQSMSKYITLTVRKGQQIKLNLNVATDNTSIRIESGSLTHEITIGTDWTGYTNFLSDSTTMTIYGDVTELGCRGNLNKISGIDISNNNALTYLDCSANSLNSIDVSQNSALATLWYYNSLTASFKVNPNGALTEIRCHGNSLDDCALDSLFNSLPERQISDNAIVYIKDDNATNPGVDGCRIPIANNKNWKAMDYTNSIEINNTTFTCIETHT